MTPMPLRAPPAHRAAVALLDILGFRDLMQTMDPQTVFEQVMRATPNLRANAVEMSAVEGSAANPVKTLAFSDTILIYRSEVVDHVPGGSVLLPPPDCVKAVGHAVADLILGAVRLDRPILFRGTIAWGECVISENDPRCYIGKPIVEAHDLEHEQEWVGAALAPSAVAVVGQAEDGTSPFVECAIPLKSGTAGGLAVNWVKHMGEAEQPWTRFPLPSQAASEELRAAVLKKHENTKAFIHQHQRRTPPPEVSYDGGKTWSR